MAAAQATSCRAGHRCHRGGFATADRGGALRLADSVLFAINGPALRNTRDCLFVAGSPSCRRGETLINSALRCRKRDAIAVLSHARRAAAVERARSRSNASPSSLSPLLCATTSRARYKSLASWLRLTTRIPRGRVDAIRRDCRAPCIWLPTLSCPLRQPPPSPPCHRSIRDFIQ